MSGYTANLITAMAVLKTYPRYMEGSNIAPHPTVEGMVVKATRAGLIVYRDEALFEVLQLRTLKSTEG